MMTGGNPLFLETYFLQMKLLEACEISLFKRFSFKFNLYKSECRNGTKNTQLKGNIGTMHECISLCGDLDGFYLLRYIHCPAYLVELALLYAVCPPNNDIIAILYNTS